MKRAAVPTLSFDNTNYSPTESFLFLIFNYSAGNLRRAQSRLFALCNKTAAEYFTEVNGNQGPVRGPWGQTLPGFWSQHRHSSPSLSH